MNILVTEVENHSDMKLTHLAVDMCMLLPSMGDVISIHANKKADMVISEILEVTFKIVMIHADINGKVLFHL